MITDRLHTSVLSFLQFKHHIYLDNSYKKIKTREAAFEDLQECNDKEGLRDDSASSMAEAIQKAIHMLSVYEFN